MALKPLLLLQPYLSSQSIYVSSFARIKICDESSPSIVEICGVVHERSGLGLKQPHLSLRRCIFGSISTSSLHFFHDYTVSSTRIEIHNKSNPNFGNTSCGVHRRSVLSLITLMAFSPILLPVNEASGIDFDLIASDQTVEEAESKIRDHAEALLEVKGLIESKSWKEAQRALRSRSSYLKQDIRTIIMFKPANERPPLRKLYAFLFSNVTSLDYGARDKDAARVWECYDNIVVAIADILSRV